MQRMPQTTSARLLQQHFKSSKRQLTSTLLPFPPRLSPHLTGASKQQSGSPVLSPLHWLKKPHASVLVQVYSLCCLQLHWHRCCSFFWLLYASSSTRFGPVKKSMKAVCARDATDLPTVSGILLHCWCIHGMLPMLGRQGPSATHICYEKQSIPKRVVQTAGCALV